MSAQTIDIPQVPVEGQVIEAAGMEWIWTTQDPTGGGELWGAHWKSRRGKLVRIFPPEPANPVWVVQADSDFMQAADRPDLIPMVFAAGREFTK